MKNLKEKILFYKDKVDKYLSELFTSLQKSDLTESMKYSVLNGGKRLRPVLMLITCELLKVDTDRALPFACAIEIIHSSSLVHDDLPALDNDDLRRGKPSCHKKFGEAQAILCGDALLNLAYEIFANNIKCEQDVQCFKVLSEFSGQNGMLGGQFRDITCEKMQKYSLDDLVFIQNNKTAKLIAAPLCMASCLSGGQFYNQLLNFGLNLGVAFQIADDVLDAVGDERLGKTIGKDLDSGKLTDIKLYGLEKSRQRVKDFTQSAINYISQERQLDLLCEFAKELVDRVK